MVYCENFGKSSDNSINQNILPTKVQQGSSMLWFLSKYISPGKWRCECSDCSYTVTEEADEGGDGSDGDGLGGGAEEGDAAVRDEAAEHRRHLRATR